MNYDADIEKLVADIEKDHHPLETAIKQFVDSLPGHNNRFHRMTTVKKYEACLTKGPHNLLLFLKNRGKNKVDELKKDDMVLYKDELLNKLDQTSVRPYITSLKQMCQYLFRLGWLNEDLSLCVRVPKVRKKELIKTVPREVEDQVVNGEWGINSFVKARNHLIACLFLHRGLHPKEFPPVTEAHIHPYRELAYMTVFGKRDEPRDVMLDPVTFDALKVYMVERAHLMHVRKLQEKHIFLSLVSQNGMHVLTIPGVQAVIRRIKEQLKLKGCLWDLSALNPQGCRRTAVSRDYERAENSPVFHPEMTLCGQYGHSLTIAQKHYWRKSLKNAYRLVNGETTHTENCRDADEPIDERDLQVPKKPNMGRLFPPDSFFSNFGMNI